MFCYTCFQFICLTIFFAFSLNIVSGHKIDTSVGHTAMDHQRQFHPEPLSLFSNVFRSYWRRHQHRLMSTANMPGEQKGSTESPHKDVFALVGNITLIPLETLIKQHEQNKFTCTKQVLEMIDQVCSLPQVDSNTVSNSTGNSTEKFKLFLSAKIGN